MVYEKKSGIKKTLKFAGLLVLAQAALPLLAAAGPAGVPSVPVPTPSKLDIGEMFGKIRDYFFGAVIIACVFMVLWAAFDIATAGDDENKVTGAKKRLLYALVGMVIAAMSMAIVALMRSIVKA